MANSLVGLAGDQALAIAQADAARAYRDLSLYRIQLVFGVDLYLGVSRREFKEH